MKRILIILTATIVLISISAQNLPTANFTEDLLSSKENYIVSDLYTRDIENIIANNDDLTPEIKEYIYERMLTDLISEGSYQKALYYFDREPLRSFVEYSAPYLLDLCSCALILNRFDEASGYYTLAYGNDPLLAEEYASELSELYIDSVVTDPEALHIVVWIIENSENPVERTLSFLLEMKRLYFPENGFPALEKFVRCDALSPEVYDTMNCLIEKGLSLVDLFTYKRDRYCLELIRNMLNAYMTGNIADAISIFEKIDDQLKSGLSR